MIFIFEHCTADGVHDGDTFWAVIDLGVRVFTRQKIRIHGVQAVELKETGGAEAQQILAELLPPETPLEIRSKRWSYDRLEGVVWVKPVGGDAFDLGQRVIAELRARGLVGGR